MAGQGVCVACYQHGTVQQGAFAPTSNIYKMGRSIRARDKSGLTHGWTCSSPAARSSREAEGDHAAGQRGVKEAALGRVFLPPLGARHDCARLLPAGENHSAVQQSGGKEGRKRGEVGGAAGAPLRVSAPRRTNRSTRRDTDTHRQQQSGTAGEMGETKSAPALGSRVFKA